MYGNGTFTTEGITTLCEALKGSTVTSLECAAAPSVRFLSGPIDTAHVPPLNPTHAVLKETGSVPKEEPRLQRASRATRRGDRSSKPPAS